MDGMDRESGLALSGEAHLIQSIGDILSTPIGTRVMRRAYGFDHALLDAPMSPPILIEVFVGVAEAIRRWEPRLTLRRVRLDETGADGAATLTLWGDVEPEAPVGGERVPVELVVPLRPPNDKPVTP